MLATLFIAATAALTPHYLSADEVCFAAHTDKIIEAFKDGNDAAEPDSYTLIDIDGDGLGELVLNDKRSNYAVVFSCGGGEVREVITRQERFNMVFADGKLWCSGSPGGPSTYTSFVELSGSRVKTTGSCLTIYGDGTESNEYFLNGKESDAAAAAQYFVLPEKVWPVISSIWYPFERLTGKLPESELSGRYSYDMAEEDGKPAPCGQLNIARNGKGQVWFSADAVNTRGNTAQLSSNGWIDCEGNVIYYQEDCGDGKYYEVWIELYGTCAVVTEDFSHGGYGLFGMGAGLGGVYYHNEDFVSDRNGYFYELERKDGGKAVGARLVGGGFYKGDVEVPQTIAFSEGRDLPVTGISKETFMYSTDVTSVKYPEGIRLGQASLLNRDLAGSVSAADPVFGYPDDYFKSFISPAGEKDDAVGKNSGWIIFKHNVQEAENVSFRKAAEDRMGRTAVSKCTGTVASLRDKNIKSSMFKGYKPYEVEVLFAGDGYVATHEFPAFSRWKHPERKEKMAKWFIDDMQARFGRNVREAYKIGNLRQGDGTLAIAEFENVNNEAMIAIAWIESKTVMAVYTEKTGFADSEEDSIWGVDAGADYGIPSLISIARDADGGYDFFLVHDTPESVDYFILRQEGQALLEVSSGSWYRWED